MLHGSDLYKLGVNYHDFGKVKNKTFTYGYYYKCDKLTLGQKDAIMEKFPHVEFKTVSPEYAPELKKVVIVFLSKAQLKRNKNQL